MVKLSQKQSVGIVLTVLALGAVVVGIFLLQRKEAPAPLVTEQPQVTSTAEVIPPAYTVIGTSVEGRNIEAYTYGSGKDNLIFVGGIHGGYEWNSVVLAYQFIDYLKENPRVIPPELTITVIPSANPDGVYAVVGIEGKFTPSDVPTTTVPAGTGRFNANGVDLNRNFDCKWKPESMWRGKVVSAGTEAFSEPEAVAIRDYILGHPPLGVVFWHSQSNAVYASECINGILPETLTLMNVYAKAAGYPAVSTFDAYPITGDAEGWLASIDIPAITVELKTHETIEWEKNLTGVTALLEHFKTTRTK